MSVIGKENEKCQREVNGVLQHWPHMTSSIYFPLVAMEFFSDLLKCLQRGQRYCILVLLLTIRCNKNKKQSFSPAGRVYWTVLHLWCRVRPLHFSWSKNGRNKFFLQDQQISGSMNHCICMQHSGFMSVDLSEAWLCGSTVQMLFSVHQTIYMFKSQAHKSQITCILQDYIMQSWTTAYCLGVFFCL